MAIEILHRKESLIMTAIDIINELGVQGLSIREVAQRQNISTAAIFSHFKSKNDLITSTLDYFMQYDEVILESVKAKNLHSTDAILHYIDLYYTYYENYPAITAILYTFEGFRNEPVLANKVKDITESRIDVMVDFLKEAQAAREIRDDIEAGMLADIVLGTTRTICLRWRMEGYSFLLKETVIKAAQLILDSFSIKEGSVNRQDKE